MRHFQWFLPTLWQGLFSQKPIGLRTIVRNNKAWERSKSSLKYGIHFLNPLALKETCKWFIYKNLLKQNIFSLHASCFLGIKNEHHYRQWLYRFTRAASKVSTRRLERLSKNAIFHFSSRAVRQNVFCAESGLHNNWPLSDFLGGSESEALMAFSTKASDNPKGFSNFLGQKLSRWSIHISHKAWIRLRWTSYEIFEGTLFSKETRFSFNRWLVLKGMHCVDP